MCCVTIRRMWLTFTAAVATSSALGFVALIVLQVWVGVPTRSAVGLALGPLALWIWSSTLYARTSWGGWMPSRNRQRLQLTLWSVMIGVVSAVLLNALFGPVAAGLGGLAAGIVGWWRYRRMLATELVKGTQLLKTAMTPPEMNELIAACRQQLLDSSMTAQRRSKVRLNLASALTNRQALADDPAGLLEAAEILSDLLADPAVDLATRAVVAMELSGTKSMLASISGSDEGWEQALDQQMEIARQLPHSSDRASAVMRAHDERAQFHMFRLSRLPAPTDADSLAVWDGELDLVIRCVEQALAAAPRKAEMLPNLLMEQGAYIAMRNPEVGVEKLREAYRSVRRRPLPRRENIQLAFAMQLVGRARIREDEDAPGELVESDLNEAERLATEIAERGQVLTGHAAGLLAEISRFREER